ncbi:MAG: hypothetical protein Q9182_002987 [Xanthomendoza sp. 2 TL-2023]
MPLHLPGQNPSKLTTITYQCGHSRYFQIQEVTSAFAPLHPQDEKIVSPFRSRGTSPSARSSVESLELPFVSRGCLSGEGCGGGGEEAVHDNRNAKNGSHLALLRIVDPDGLCPSCTTAVPELRMREWVWEDLEEEEEEDEEDEDFGETVGLRTSVEGDEDKDEDLEKGEGWWDVVHLEGSQDAKGQGS